MVFIVSLIIGLSLSTFAQENTKNYVTPTDEILLQESLTQIRTQKLYLDPQWQRIVHYKRNLFFQLHSQISDPHFFLASNGSTNPQSEMEATLQSFFATNDLLIKPKGWQPSQCQFPLRLVVLKELLGKDLPLWKKLPSVQCTELNTFVNLLAAKSVSFVFSSYYTNSPGSAFGHTLFRINKKPLNSTRRQELLDYGVGFAANVTTDNGLAYAALGIAGGFTGSWTNIPYYYKVREYNDYESRDLWSYDLNLTADEVDRLILHLWEVGPRYYTYYFFTQNCAFHMLTLLEAAAPRLDLSSQVPALYVLPIDSLKAITESKSLLQGVQFRPSLRRTFLERYQLLEASDQSDFQKFSKNFQLPSNFSQRSDQRRAVFLDAALDLIDLKDPSLALTNEASALKVKNDFLAQRAAVDYITPPLKVTPKASERPDLSHATSRMGLRYYQNESNESYLNYEFRFALHDLMDPIPGLPSNSQLEFGNFKLVQKKSFVELDEFSLIRVTNLNPLQFYELRPSWFFDLGVKEIPYCSNSENCLASGFQIKVGLANETQGLIYWAMGNTSIRHSYQLLDNPWYAAPGLELGFIKRFQMENSLMGRYLVEYPIDRKRLEDWELEYRHHYNLNLSFGVSLKNSYAGLVVYKYF